MGKQNYVCKICGLQAGSKLALKTHQEMKHGNNPKEVKRTMEEREVRNIVRDEITIANQLREMKETVKRLQEELNAKSKELEAKATLEDKLKEAESKVTQLEKLQQEVNRLSNLSHVEIARQLFDCPECRPGLQKKILKLICDDRGCRLEVLKTIPKEELEEEIKRREEKTNIGSKSAFTIGLGT